MSLFEGIIKKDDVPDDSETISKNSELVSVAEMAVNVLLFGMGGR